MKQLIQKYTEQLAVLKENRANTVDTNADAENEQYDRLIRQVAGFIRELKQLNLPVVTNRTCSFCGETEFETTESQYNDVDNDYDRCAITYCTKCRNTHSIEI